MAIFNMEDSSINEYINEHGGAHRRIIDNIEKEKDVLDKKRYKINRAAISQEKKGALESKVDDKERELSNKSKRLLGHGTNGFEYVSKPAHKHGLHDRDGYDYDEDDQKNIQSVKRSLRYQAARKQPKNPEMHRIINQRSKLKEAAEYILSVLDEMDYIEESEKK